MEELKKKTSDKIIKGNFFTLVKTYYSFFISLSSNFIIARILSPEDWGYLLLGLYTITIPTLIIAYFPPAANLMLNQLIPQYFFKNMKNKLKSLISSIFFTKIIVSSISWVIFFLIFLINVNRGIFFQICIILSPIIILNIFQDLLINSLRGFHKFGKATAIILVQLTSLLVSYIIIFLINPPNPLIAISYSNLFSYLFSTIIGLIFLVKFPTKSDRKNKLINLREIFTISKDYGIYPEISSTLSNGANLLNQYFLFYFGAPDFITYYKISQNSVNFSLEAAGTLSTPYLPIFSELSIKKQYKKMEDILYKIVKYNGLIQCILTALIFFYIDVYISIIYTEVYLSITIFIQILLFQGFGHLVGNNLNIILFSMNKQKIAFKRDMYFLSLKISLSFIGIYFFGFIGFIVFNVLLTYIKLALTCIIINIKRFNGFVINIWSLMRLYILFLISLLISLIPYFLILNIITFESLTIDDIALRILKDSIGFGLFAIIFYIIIFLTRTITKEEISDLLNRDILSRNLKGINNWVSKLLIKFFPSKRDSK